MSDLISRQAAIDAVSEACFELRGVFGRCEDALKALPSAQPEIIRCKDCKHTYLSDNFGITAPWLMCKRHIGNTYKVNEDDYCSHAKRKEE